MNGISQQMQLEFAAGVADLDDKPALILVCVRVGHDLLPAHPLLGKEHEQLRLRQLVSKAAVAPEHRCNDAIPEQRLQLCGAGGNLAREMLAERLYLDRLAGLRIFDQRANFDFRSDGPAWRRFGPPPAPPQRARIWHPRAESADGERIDGADKPADELRLRHRSPADHPVWWSAIAQSSDADADQ